MSSQVALWHFKIRLRFTSENERQVAPVDATNLFLKAGATAGRAPEKPVPGQTELLDQSSGSRAARVRFAWVDLAAASVRAGYSPFCARSALSF